jgi:hypothetical protein
MSLIVMNALWLVLMLVLTAATASSLDVLGTNPLGLSFLAIFGGLFALQFLAMLRHRLVSLVEYLAGVVVASPAPPAHTGAAAEAGAGQAVDKEPSQEWQYVSVNP